MDAIERLLRRQAGVVSRRQVLDAGMSEVLVARRVRRREWVRLADGVYVDHTGQLTTAQAEWATLLRHPGSVLAGRSALRAGGLRGATGQDRARRIVEIAVPHGRRLDADPGVSVVRAVTCDWRVCREPLSRHTLRSGSGGVGRLLHLGAQQPSKSAPWV